MLCIAYRIEEFVIGVTNEDPAKTPPVFKTSYTVCAQYSGPVGASENATVYCKPSLEKFRFVIVQSSFTKKMSFCLTEVYVRESGKCTVLQKCSL